MNHYRTVTELTNLQAYLAGQPVVAFDFETASNETFRNEAKAALDPHKAHIVGVSFSVAEGSAVYVPVAHRTGKNIDSPERMWAWLKDNLYESKSVIKVAHNLSFEAMFLYAMGIVVKAPCYDTIAASQLTLKSKWEFRCLHDSGLKLLATTLFCADMPSFETVTAGRHFDEMNPQEHEALRYACADSDYTLRLYYKLLGTFVSDLILQVLSFVAENERDNIRKRQAQGIAAAKARGVRFGRPEAKLPEKFPALLQKWERQQISTKELLKECDFSESTLYRRVRKMRKENQK